jgi:hypothetical protein
MSPGRTRKPVLPGATSELLPVESAHTTGSALAIASSVTMPKVSVTLGKKKTSDEA